jgi:hypothetical protein
MKVENKTEIKHRMLKKAAEHWGVSAHDIESSFDPVVSLLIGACASELAKISHDINGAQNRITEKLVELMTPEGTNGAYPCNAIAHAIPTDPTSEVNPTHQFYTQKRLKDTDGNTTFKTVFLSPVRRFKLIKANIVAAVTSSTLLQFDTESKGVETTAIAKTKAFNVASSTMYLGIAKAEETIFIKGTSLFFEIGDMAHAALFYSQLQQADFYFNGERMNVSSGYFDSHADDANYIKKRLSAVSKKMLAVEEQASINYKQHFVSIQSQHALETPAAVPDFLEGLAEADQEALTNLNWIKVVFPSTISAAILKSVHVSFNSFPVLNRRLEHTTYQLNDFTHIVPFSTSNLFLDIHRITNASGNTYTLFGEQDVGQTKGAYALRTENVSKLDSRKAQDYLLHLIDLLKNESAAFSVYGGDFMETNVGKLNQTIALIENKLEESNLVKSNTHYVSINPYGKKESIFIEFWSTLGDDANQLRSNTTLKTYKGAAIEDKGCYLVTPTAQGRNTLSSKEQLLKYRHHILAQERVVTREDVKALCFDVCGDKITKVEVCKRFVVHQHYQKGKLPTLEVRLFKNTAVATPEIEWNMLKSNIEVLLEERSTNVLPFSVQIN